MTRSYWYLLLVVLLILPSIAYAQQSFVLINSHPADGESYSTPYITVVLTFNAPIGAAVVTMSKNGTPVQGNTTYNGNEVTFTPVSPLADGTYTVDFSGVSSVAGAALLDPPTSMTFTVDTVGPTLVSSIPHSGQTGVSPDTTITLNFSELLMIEDLPFTPVVTSSLTPDIPVELEVVSVQGTVYVYRPLTPLLYGNQYTVDYSAATDRLMNPMQLPTSFSFTVEPPPSPTLVSSSPAANAQNVPIDTVIELKFSKPMNFATSVIALINGGTVQGTVTSQQDPTTLFFVPNEPLAYGTTYTCDFSRARDFEDLTPSGNTSITFRTLSPPAFTLLSSTPANGQQAVSTGTPITLTFNNNVDPASSVVTLQSNSEVITGSLNVLSNTVTFYPDKPIRSATNYTLSFSGVKDIYGQSLSGTTSIQFSTEIGDYSGSVDPPVINATANESVGITYIIRNNTDQPVTLRSSEAEFLVNGTTVATVNLPVTAEVPANSTVNVASDAMISNEIQQAARTAGTDLVVMMRNFRGLVDNTTVVSIPLIIRLTGSLAGPVTVTDILVDVPTDSKMIGQFDQIRAHAYIRGTGTGAVVAHWTVDGIPTETIQINMVAGITQEVWSRMSLPTIDLGEHNVQLQVVRPTPITSNSRRYVVVAGTTGSQRVILSGPSASTSFLPGVTPGVFSWLPMPGASGYEIAFASDMNALGLDRDGNIAGGFFGQIVWNDAMVNRGSLAFLARTPADTLYWKPSSTDYSKLLENEGKLLYWAVRAIYPGERSGDPTSTSRPWRIMALPKPDNLTLNEPADGSTIKDSSVFNWESYPDAATYRLTLTSYRGETHSALTTNTSFVLPVNLAKQLRQGQYVWQVVAASPKKGIIAASEKRAVNVIAQSTPYADFTKTVRYSLSSTPLFMAGLPVILPGAADQIIITPANGTVTSDFQPQITAVYPEAKAGGVLMTLNGVDVTSIANITSTEATLEPPGMFSEGDHKIGVIVETVGGLKLEAESVFSIKSEQTPGEPSPLEFSIAPPKQAKPLNLQFDWNWNSMGNDFSFDSLVMDLNLTGEQSWLWRNNSYAALNFQVSRPAGESLDLTNFLAHAGISNDRYKMMMGDVGSTGSELTSQGLTYRSFNFVTNTGPLKFTGSRTLGSKIQRSSMGRAPDMMYLSAETTRFATGPGLKLTYTDSENSFSDYSGFGGASKSKILSLRGQTPLGATGLSLRGEIANSDSQSVSAYGTQGTSGTAYSTSLDGSLWGFGIMASYKRVGQDYLSPASMTLTNNLNGWNVNISRPIGQYMSLIGNYVTLDNLPTSGSPSSSSLTRSIDLVANYPNLPSLSLKFGKNSASSAPFVEGGTPTGNEENVFSLSTSYAHKIWSGYLSYSHSDFDDLIQVINPAIDIPNDRKNNTWSYGLSIQPNSALKLRFDYGSNDSSRWFLPLLATEPLFGTDGARQSRLQLEYRPLDRLSATLAWAKSEYGDALGTFRSDISDLNLRLNYFVKISAIGGFVITGELRKSKWEGTAPGVSKTDFSILINDNRLLNF